MTAQKGFLCLEMGLSLISWPTQWKDYTKIIQKIWVSGSMKIQQEMYSVDSLTVKTNSQVSRTLALVQSELTSLTDKVKSGHKKLQNWMMFSFEVFAN